METPISECQLNTLLGEALDEGAPDRIVQELARVAEQPESLAEDVSPARVLVVASEVLERFERYDEAVEMGRRAVDAGTSGGDELNPGVWLARILVVAGRSREGLAEFRRVRGQDPDDFMTYLIAGEVFEQVGDYRQAIAWLTSGAERAQRREDWVRAEMLLTHRRRVRQAQGFPEDGYDEAGRAAHDRMFPGSPLPPMEGGDAPALAQRPRTSGPGRPARAKGDGPARNQPCPCGSGKKYKRCCGDPRQPRTLG